MRVALGVRIPNGDAPAVFAVIYRKLSAIDRHLLQKPWSAGGAAYQGTAENSERTANNRPAGPSGCTLHDSMSIGIYQAINAIFGWQAGALNVGIDTLH
jgi:hypothetical protein